MSEYIIFLAVTVMLLPMIEQDMHIISVKKGLCHCKYVANLLAHALKKGGQDLYPEYGRKYKDSACYVRGKVSVH